MGSSVVDPDRERQLRGLCAELGRRLRAGEPGGAEDLLERHPHLADDEDAVIELLYTEYVTREEIGQRPSADDWSARFPRWSDRLRRLLEFHRLLGDEDEADDGPEPIVSQAGKAGGVEPGAVGPFELIEEIGRGGMGVVYKARQRALNRIVAVKMILAGSYAGERERARLRFEAEAAARLQHPNIVQIFEYGEQGDLPYIVLEYVHGKTLGQIRPLAETRVEGCARLLETLARAIDHAHERGIVHRDLTPANVLIAADGTPKISDFGLAKSLAEGGRASGSGVILGTPRYMAPEQVGGRSRDVGPAADIYALGAILYELLTGAAPFQGETPLETMRQTLEETPRFPASARPEVPADLETICLKCLERDPGRRYASAAELAEDLRRFQAGEPIRARPISFYRRLVKWVRRRPAEAALVGLILLVVAGTLAASYGTIVWQRRHGAALEAALTRERQQSAQARDDRARAEHLEMLARRHWYGSQIKLAQQAWEAEHVELAQELLENERPEPGGADLRGFEWFYLHRLCHRDVSLHWGHAAPVYALGLSPGGRLLASGDREGHVLLCDLAGDRQWTSSEPHRLAIRCLAFSADGRTLASGSGEWGESGEVKLSDVATGRVLKTLGEVGGFVDFLAFLPDGRTLLAWDRMSPGGSGRLLAWDLSLGPDQAALKFVLSGKTFAACSPDGRFVATADVDGRLSVRDASSGDVRLGLETGGSPVHALAFARDGRHLAASLGERRVSLWETGSGRLVTSFFGPDETANLLAFSPDGRFLAARGGERSVIVRQLPTGQSWVVATDESSKVHALGFAPDGRRLIVGGEALKTRIWDLETRTARVRFPREEGMIHALTFTPDGGTVVLGGEDPRIRLWHLDSRSRDPALEGHRDEAWSIAFSPDGRTLASGSDDNTIAFWDVASGRQRARFQGAEATISALAFSPDGRTLAATSLDHSVSLWDAHTCARIGPLEGHTGAVRAVAFSTDGRTLATAGSDLKVRLWDVASRSLLASVAGHTENVRALTFSPAGRFLASAGNDRQILLRLPRRGEVRQSWRTPAKITSLAFSPDGTKLASGSEDRAVTLWDVAGGVPLVSLRGHVQGVRALAFSPDGRTLASSSDDRTVRLWDPFTGQERLTLKGHRAKVNALAFSPDGRTLASASHDGAVMLWQAENRFNPSDSDSF